MINFELAEREFYNRLVTITGSTNRRNAFLGKLPNVTNCWALISNGQPNNIDYPCKDLVTINYEIRARFPERAYAIAFQNLILNAFDNGDLTGLVRVKRNFVEQLTEPQLFWKRLCKSRRNTAHYELSIPFTVNYNLRTLGGIGYMGIGIDFIVS